MDKEKLFVTSFVLSLLLTAFFLGSSITGFLIQTMNCDSSGCREFCHTDNDCTTNGEICCSSSGLPLGICELSGDCDIPYEISPEAEIQTPITLHITNQPLLEQPSGIQKEHLLLFGVLGLLILFIGYLYLVMRHRFTSKSKKQSKDVEAVRKQKLKSASEPRKGAAKPIKKESTKKGK